MRPAGTPVLHGPERTLIDARPVCRMPRCSSLPRRRTWALLRPSVLGVLLATLALPAAANAGTGPGPLAGKRISNELTATRWAHPRVRAPIRQLPTPDARRIAGVHYFTEDGFPEVYVVLRRWTGPAGRTWFKVRIPMRPNGRTGWALESAFGPLHYVKTRLVVDRVRLRATLFKSNRRIWRARIGVGAPSTPTPAGRFWIRELIKVPSAGGSYGPWAFGTSAYSTLTDWPGGGVIGIHGTNQPQLIPGRPSHGCIRIENSAISRLAHLMPIGTPVRIR